MNPTFKRIVAVIGGAAAAICIISLTEMISAHFYPPPLGLEELTAKPVAVKAVMDSMPLNAYLLVLAGWMIGSFAGGLFASRYSGTNKLRASFGVGVILFIGGIVNAIQLPDQPMWFLVTGFICFIPFALLGHLAVRKK